MQNDIIFEDDNCYSSIYATTVENMEFTDCRDDNICYLLTDKTELNHNAEYVFTNETVYSTANSNSICNETVFN